MSRDQDVCLNVARCKWQQGGDDSMTDDALRHMSRVIRSVTLNKRVCVLLLSDESEINNPPLHAEL